MNRFIVVTLAFCGAQMAWAAAEFQYYVYPVQGITGISQSGTGVRDAGPKYSGMINEKFADLFFTAPIQQALLHGFREEVKTRFPQAIIGPNQIQSGRSGKYAYQPYEVAECKPSFIANYKDTFAIAIGVSRLSAYINRYGNYVDALIPITYTLRFVKLNGAHVVFSRSETIYTRYSALANEFYAANGQDIAPAVVDKLRAAIQTDGLNMVKRQVDAAAKGFSPKQTEISVTGRDGDYIILSHGSEVGFTSNEEFEAYNVKGEELSYVIVYATNGLAVAVASDFTPEIKHLSNSVRAGDKLTFTFTKQGQDDAKPTVLAAQYPTPLNGKLNERQIVNNALSAIVADDIGFLAPFNIVKHDADFSRLKNQIRAEANCDSNMFREMQGFADNTTLKRAQPDYYLKVDSFSSPAFTAWGTGRVNSTTVFSNAVALSVMDRTGVISQSFLGNAPYTLERSAGKGLSLDEATEVNLQNAAISSLKSLLSGFTNTAKTVPIKAVASGVATLGQTLPLSALRQARLVRQLKANDRQILMPLPGDVAQIVLPTQDTDRIEVKGDVKPSDLLMISGADASNQALTRCDASRQTRFLATGLNKPSTGEEAIAAPLLAKAKGYNLVESDNAFLEAVERALQEGQFSSASVSRVAAATACYVVLEQQQLPRNDCAADKCTGTGAVASGVRIYAGPNKVAESINGARFDYADISPGALADFVGVKAYENHLGSLSVHKSKLN
jgi:hypothetical protein